MMDVRKTVSEMYKYAKEEDSLLLSSFGAENEGYHFWDEYRLKHRKYDKLFNRMFNSFKYFMQEDGETIAEITENFTDDVYAHLMVNAKKYEELYRVNVVDDSQYSILDNYNITETMDRETADEETKVYGAREDTVEYGEKEIESSNTKGNQTNIITNGISGFNSADFANDDKSNEVYGQRTDNSSETIGAHTDTNTKGEQTDTNNNMGTEEYTLTRKGNIGVRTITEVIEYHRNFWNTYEFYTYIFKEICAELLLI